MVFPFCSKRNSPSIGTMQPWARNPFPHAPFSKFLSSQLPSVYYTALWIPVVSGALDSDLYLLSLAGVPFSPWALFLVTYGNLEGPQGGKLRKHYARHRCLGFGWLENLHGLHPFLSNFSFKTASLILPTFKGVYGRGKREQSRTYVLSWPHPKSSFLIYSYLSY